MKRILTLMLIMTMAISAIACGKKETAAYETTVYEDGDIIGEGERSFELTIVDAEGKEITVEVHTDKDIVGEALTDTGILAGENGPYGLYIKTVNGDTFDYEKDGKYWAFYINGEYGMTGVDKTDIVETDTYTLKVEE